MKKISLNKSELLIGITVAGLFIVLSFYSFPVFSIFERISYGINMRLDLPGSLGKSRIAIVNIDDKSLKYLGPWPWPRHIIAEMITILKNNGARLIGSDILFSEKEQNQGLKEVNNLYNNILEWGELSKNENRILSSLKRVAKQLDNDKALSQAVRMSGNIIIPVTGSYGKYDTDLVLPRNSFIGKNSLKAIEMKSDINKIIPVNELTVPFNELLESCSGIGHINYLPDKLKAGQTHLLFINYRGHIIPSLPLRLAFDYLNKSPQEAIVEGQGIRLNQTIIPTHNWETLIKFKGGRRSFPYYSFVDILNVKKIPTVFENKIVLIGYTAKGANLVNTPVDSEMPHVELIANITDNLLSGRCLERPGIMIYIESIILLLLSLSASLIFPRLDFLNRLGLLFVSIFLVFLTGVIFFIALDFWFKTPYIAFSLITISATIGIRQLSSDNKAVGLPDVETIEANRMLGLSFQSQGLLDLAFEKFRKCPMDDSMGDVIYNLGLDYERKRMINKAISVYEYIAAKEKKFRDLDKRIPKLKKLIDPFNPASQRGRKEQKIQVSDDLDIKPTVGRYEILKEVGQGAMGIVYKARDPKINRLLAIKTIRFADEFEETHVSDVKSRFFREAEMAGKLSHPGIVSIYDVGEEYDLAYLAMEYVEGEDLSKSCKKGALFPLRKTLDIIYQTAVALDSSHKQEVFHRDIKPGNIMLLKNGQVKVTDFGIAKAMSSSETKSGVILGTPNYMSPEQINGQKIDRRSDIFSLGVVLFELLTGELPFRGKNITNLFYQIVEVKHLSPREINPKIPKPCEQIIDKALEKKQGQRFQNAGDFAKYLKAMIDKIDQLKRK